MKTCLRCGESWQSIVENPIQCPRCKSPRWNRELKYRRREERQVMPLEAEADTAPVRRIAVTGGHGAVETSDGFVGEVSEPVKAMRVKKVSAAVSERPTPPAGLSKSESQRWFREHAE